MTLIFVQNYAISSTIQLKRFAEKESKLNEARQYYAAARIQGLIRGFLARILFKKLQREYRAVLMIQKLVRGRFGRAKWMREYNKSISVVKSETALQV